MRGIFVLLLMSFTVMLRDGPPVPKPPIIKRVFLVKVCTKKKPCTMEMKAFVLVGRDPDRWERYKIQ